jgi:hypothetical protein
MRNRDSLIISMCRLSLATLSTRAMPFGLPDLREFGSSPHVSSEERCGLDLSVPSNLLTDQ